MEIKSSSIIVTLLLFLLLLLSGPGFTRARVRVKNSGSEIYEIDYRGPETHTYNPPPNRAGGRPRAHHQASLARHKSKTHGKRKK